MGDVSLNLPINADPLPASISKQGDQAINMVSDGWTNERHSNYISSMEASFMEQFYGNEHHGRDTNRSHLGSSNGFKVLREGVWENHRFEKADAQAHDGGIISLPDNPWIRRFRPRNAGVNRRGDSVGASVDDGESGTDSVRERVRTHDREDKNCVKENLVDEGSEVSDQNFLDDDVEVNTEPCKRRRPSLSTQNDQTTQRNR